MQRSISNIRFTFALILFSLALTGCGRKAPEVVPASLAQRCVVVYGDGAWSAWLARVMPASPRYPLARLAEAIERCAGADAALIVAGGMIDDDARAALEAYVEQGARLVVLGPQHPFAASAEAVRVAAGLDRPPFEITATKLRRPRGGEDVQFSAMTVMSPSPSPPGHSGEHAGPVRWIPCLEARDAQGTLLGWAASVMLTLRDHAGGSIMGWAGFDVPPQAEQLLPLFTGFLEEVTRDVYLHQYGIDRHAVDSQQRLRVRARVLDRRLNVAPVRLVARWINSSGTEVRRHVSLPLESTAQPVELAVGLAPEPAGGRAGVFELELLVRDRNDQQTLASASQRVKIFPRDMKNEIVPVSVDKGMLMQKPLPLFMLGVNYWPRTGAPHAGSSANGHWLNPEWFQPEIITSDLDRMTAAGINTIAIEYTDARQAPQLRYLLEELRKRSMWASVYMPALHPLDLRLEAALEMLRAVDLAQWPEMYALELARGIHIRSRADLRRLDEDWADWLDEHFNSTVEAEQKIGVTLWRERNRMAGPPDLALRAGPHQDRAVALYYSFLRDYVSRRMGYARQALRAEGYTTLITARSAYGWPEGRPEDVIDSLDISAGVMHLDFLSPDAWSFHPLHAMHEYGGHLAAYLRGLGGGKPVVWSAFGQDVSQDDNAESTIRQKEVFQYFMDLFLREGSSGALAWRYASGVQEPSPGDWGLMLPQGTWRPVEEAIRATRLQLRRVRPQAPAMVRGPAPLVQSARQWEDQRERGTGIFAPSDRPLAVTEWMPPGTGLDSHDLLDDARKPVWTPIDGLHVLNAEWGTIRAANVLLPRQPAQSVRTYAGRTLQLDLVNSGTIRWATAPGARREGSVWIHLSQPGGLEEWLPANAAASGAWQTVTWTPREPGRWEIQAYLTGYGKFGERLRVEVTTPPGLF